MTKIGAESSHVFMCVWWKQPGQGGGQEGGAGGFSLGSLIERRQQHGKDSSHNSDPGVGGRRPRGG